MRHVAPSELNSAAPVAVGRRHRRSGDFGAADVRRRNRWRLLAFGTALVAVVVAATLYIAYDMRRRTTEEAERELVKVGRILAEQTTLSLRAVELVQTSVIDSMRALGIETSDDVRQRTTDHAMHRMLAEKIVNMPQIDTLAILDAAGMRVNSSREWPTSPLDLSARDYFRALEANPAAATFLGAPVERSGEWTVYFARKITSDTGRFLGVVVAGIELRHFQTQFATIARGADASVTMLRDDGVLLARYPSVEGTVGQRFSDLATAARGADAAVLRRISEIDGKDRLIAPRRLAGLPAMVTVSSTVESMAAGVETDARRLTAVGLALAAAIGVLIVLIARRSEAERDEAERTRKNQQRKLDAALNNMSQGLVIFDPDGRIVLSNDRYVAMYGLERSTVAPGCDLLTLAEAHKGAGTFLGDPVQYCVDVMKDVAHGGSETTLDLPDGRTIYIITRQIDGGGWVVTHEDVTERRRTERERDRNRDFLDRVIENVPTMIIVKDARDLRYVLVNREAEDKLGFDGGAGVGHSAHDVFPREVADRLESDDRVALASRQIQVVSEQEITNTAHEACIYRLTRVPILDDDGNPLYLLVVAEDLTGRKAMERQLQQAGKMEAIGNLTGGIAHDFNNLLMVMIGNLDLLVEEIVDQPSAHEKVEAVLKSALHGAELTRQMLAFARRQPLNPKRVELGDLLASTVKLLMRTLGTDITVDLQLPDDLWPVRVDESQLQSSIVNVAINSRDAMPGGGRATIAARNIAVDEHRADLHSHLAPGDYVEISIADSGRGIPADVIARVFEPFFTTKAQGRGTGLGLSMVYGFARQSGGHVAVASEIGRGTTVKIYLPRTTIEAVQKTAEASHVLVGAGEVVLAVDDNRDVLVTVARQLDEIGYKVVTAGSAFSALRMLEGGLKPDVLFTDIVMPGGLNGAQLADIVRERYPGLRILLTSGFNDAFGVDDAVVNTKYSLLTKPYRKQDLARTIRRLLDEAPVATPTPQ
jgi:PAS domain S-box-containing protein